jgi:hypothetical protein
MQHHEKCEMAPAILISSRIIEREWLGEIAAPI